MLRYLYLGSLTEHRTSVGPANPPSHRRSALPSKTGATLVVPIRVCISVLLAAVISGFSTPNSFAAGNPETWTGRQNIRIPRLGRVQISFPIEQPTASTATGIKVHRLVGIVAGTGERVAISHSVDRGQSGRFDEILFNARNPRSGRSTFIRITSDSERSLSVSSVPGSLLSAVSCGSEARRTAPSNSRRPAASDAHVVQTTSESNASSHQHADHRAPAITLANGANLKVAFVADQEYNRRFGARTEQHLVTMLDQVNAIFKRDLNLTVTPVLLARERASVAQLRSAESNGLLDGLATLAGRQRYGNADIYHLLTGKELVDNIIGLANLPAACAPDRAMRVSLSQLFNSAIDYMTIAHELGHNLGADHDTETAPSSLMFPSLPADSVAFSRISQGEIARFREESLVRACLNSQPVTRSEVSLKISLGANGASSLSLGLPTRNDSCSVVLESSMSANFTTTNKILLSSIDTFSLKINSIINSRPDSNKRVFVRATATCGEFVSVAKTEVSTKSLSRTLPRITSASWSKRFLESFR